MTKKLIIDPYAKHLFNSLEKEKRIKLTKKYFPKDLFSSVVHLYSIITEEFGAKLAKEAIDSLVKTRKKK